MNFDLAQMYGTTVSREVSEDQEKVAQAELFAKLAAENGIDLNQLSDEQVTALWGATFEKDAEDESSEEKKDEKKDEKKEKEAETEEKAAAAVAEFEAQKEWQEKVAEMDYLGRLMAHAYVQELGSINENLEKQAFSITESGHKLDTAKAGVKAKAHEEMAESERKYERSSPYLSQLKGPMASAHQLAARHESAKERAHSQGENVYNPFKGMATKTKAEKERLKQSSAIDEFAAQLAVEKAAAAGWDGDEAVARINSVFTLGAIGPSEKIAAAADVDGAVDVRSLEILEAAGYPVTWE